MQLARPGIERPRSRLALCTLLALTAFAVGQSASAGGPGVADPDYWNQTAERQNTVNRFVYSQSPQPIPSSYDPVAEAEQVLRQRQATLPPSNPKAPSLWQQIRGITVKSALSTPPRALGTVSLLAGTATAGWKIGSWANAKFLKFGIPEASDGPHNYRWNKILWTRALTGEYSGARAVVQFGTVGIETETRGIITSFAYPGWCRRNDLSP